MGLINQITMVTRPPMKLTREVYGFDTGLCTGGPLGPGQLILVS